MAICIVQYRNRPTEKYYLSEKALATISRKERLGIIPKVNPEKSGTVTTGNQGSKMSLDNSTTLILCGASRGRNPDNPKSRKVGDPTEQMIEFRQDGKTICLTTVSKDNYIIQLNPSTESGGVQPFQQNRVYHTDGKSPALLAQMSSGTHAIAEPMIEQRSRGKNKGGLFEEGKTPKLTSNSWEHNNWLHMHGRIRRLTPIECERLQGIPDGYTDCVSDTQRYRMLGNGWQVDVIEYIFSYMGV